MFININNFDSMPVDSSIDEVCGLLGVNGMNAAEYNTTVKDMKTLINKLSNKYPKKNYIQKVFPIGRKYSKTVIEGIHIILSKYQMFFDNIGKAMLNILAIG